MVNLSDSSLHADVYEDYDKPPPPEQHLVEIYRAWQHAGNSSEHIPREPLEAARWWIDRQEPRDPAQKPRRNIDRRGLFIGWTCPYSDRLSGNFRLFLALSEPQKAFVLDHIEQGIPWRGDSIANYKAHIEQVFEMQKNPEAYRHLAEMTRKEVTRGKPKIT